MRDTMSIIGLYSYDPTIFETFKVNHPRTHLIEGDIRKVSRSLLTAV